MSPDRAAALDAVRADLVAWLARVDPGEQLGTAPAVHRASEGRAR